MTPVEEYRIWLQLKNQAREYLSLKSDKADDALIDERIRSETQIKGANLWILIFAIFVASIGLNVNSTAVIIGAMLISPLMGPIMGIGYGAGINDFTLIRLSFRHLSIATLIALATSTLYFLVSPLDTAQSELLARTTPTIWDVLIGFFGGLAGIVGITRKEKSNVIPGVAIATALMPPLCTAGFGLASGNLDYFFGAFYLFTINFVFIAFSAFVIVQFFNISDKKYIDPVIKKKAHKTILMIVIATMLPSSYLAYQLVGEQVFKAKASAFVNDHFSFEDSNVAQVKIDPKTHEVKVFVIGEHIPQAKLTEISTQMKEAGLKDSTLKVYQNGQHDTIDSSVLKADIVADLYANAQTKLEQKENTIAALNKELHSYAIAPKVIQELRALFPRIKDPILSQTTTASRIVDANETQKIWILNMATPLSAKEHHQIHEWLKIRLGSEHIMLYTHKAH